MATKLYLVTNSGERHEDHIPVMVCDYKTLCEKFAFANPGDLKLIEDLNVGCWLTDISITEPSDTDDYKNLSETERNSIDDFGWFVFGNILCVDLNKEIKLT